MSDCISVIRGPASMYPVFDVSRLVPPSPYTLAYGFAWDAVEIDVSDDPSLASCEMKITIVSNFSWYKEIAFWNYFLNGPIGNNIGTTPGLQSSRIITRPLPTQTCLTGVDTIVLCKQMGPSMTGLYSFDPVDFWDFWGGYAVKFVWEKDDAGSNVWGAETPQPQYPGWAVPDGTLVQVPNTMQFSVVFGGASFAINNVSDLPALGLDPNNAVPDGSLPAPRPIPADFTLVRELNRPEVFVVYGGAKFWIPSPQTLFGLGFNWSQVHVIPPGGTNQLASIPMDKTLIKEQHDPKVFLVAQQQLCWVTSPAAMESNCLAWRHVRTVPDGALAALPRGPNL
jgi:hypothetical protein